MLHPLQIVLNLYNFNKTIKKFEVLGSLTGGSRKLQGAETNVVECFVVQNHTFVSILDELMHRESGIIRFHDCIRNFWRWENGESKHHAIRVLLSDLGYEEGSHARASSSSQRMADLKS